MSDASVTWLGHATALVDLGGQRVLVDPLGRKRAQRAGHYHAVLITHAHVDHLNRWTLAKLDKSVPLYVPKGAKHCVTDLGFAKVREVEPGDELAVGHLDIVGVPTKHDSGRWRKGDAPICMGYMIVRDGVAVHHAGDVDMSDFEVFDEMGDRFNIDVTMLPIGGMLPVWYYRMRRRALDRGVHIDPDTALELAARLGARTMIPVHWGTVQVPIRPSRTAARRLAKIAAKTLQTDRVRILRHGERLDIRPRPLLPPARETKARSPAAGISRT